MYSDINRPAMAHRRSSISSRCALSADTLDRSLTCVPQEDEELLLGKAKGKLRFFEHVKDTSTGTQLHDKDLPF